MSNMGKNKLAQSNVNGQSKETKKDDKVKNLGHYADITRDVLGQLSKTNDVLLELGRSYEQHYDAVNQVTRWKEDAEKAAEKNNELEQAIRHVTSICRQDQEELRMHKLQLEEGFIELQAEKAGLLSESQARDAEQQRRMERELERLKKEQRKMAEASEAQREEFHKKRTAEIELQSKRYEKEKKILATDLDKQSQTVQKLEHKLKTFEDENESLKRACQSWRAENEGLKNEKQRHTDELGLIQHPREFYTKSFSTIQNDIHSFSMRYLVSLEDIEPKVLEVIHGQLQESDKDFRDVPISDSDDSTKLCQAHIQRIISTKLCEHFWNPFSAGCTRQNKALAEFLIRLESGVRDGPSHGRRAYAVWKSQTMQALRVTSTSNSQATTKDCAEEVLRAIEPLISHSKFADARRAMMQLAKNASELWHQAMKDELDIRVSGDLNSFEYTGFRSDYFDPVPANDSDAEATSSKDVRIICLFPRVIGREVVLTRDVTDGMPGSFSASRETSPSKEVCIHPGLGLASISELVRNGRRELAAMAEELEEVKRDLHSKRAASHKSRRQSVVEPRAMPGTDTKT